jgi:hypothetical protein
VERDPSAREGAGLLLLLVRVVLCEGVGGGGMDSGALRIKQALQIC